MQNPFADLLIVAIAVFSFMALLFSFCFKPGMRVCRAVTVGLVLCTAGIEVALWTGLPVDEKVVEDRYAEIQERNESYGHKKKKYGPYSHRSVRYRDLAYAYNDYSIAMCKIYGEKKYCDVVYRLSIYFLIKKGYLLTFDGEAFYPRPREYWLDPEEKPSGKEQKLINELI